MFDLVPIPCANIINVPNRWYSLSGIEPNLVVSSPRIKQLAPVLAIEAVTPEDSKLFL